MPVGRPTIPILEIAMIPAKNLPNDVLGKSKPMQMIFILKRARGITGWAVEESNAGGDAPAV
jgi:hypothetical protein